MIKRREKRWHKQNVQILNIERHFYFFLCQILTTFNKMTIMSEPLRGHDHRNFQRECSSCFTCGTRSVTNSQNLVNRLNWVKGSIVISKLLHDTYMSLSPNISSIISITLSIGLAVTITLFTTSELIPRRRLRSGGLHDDSKSIKQLCKILKSFIFTSTSTKHWPPSTSWKWYQNLHMSIEGVKSIYRFHRLVFNREDSNLKCFNRATKS
jgi:hypothetical protein